MLLLLAMGHVLHGAQNGIHDGPELLDLSEPLLPVPGLLQHVVQDARQGRAAGAGPVRSRAAADRICADARSRRRA